MIAGLIAISGLVMVVVAKFFTTNQIQNLRREVAEAQADNGKLKTELHMIENNKAVAIQNLKTEERIQRTLKLQVEKNANTLANLKK